MTETTSISAFTQMNQGHDLKKTTDSSGLFAKHLEEEMGKTANTNWGSENQSEHDRDIAILKEKGFTGYFKELQARKMEELREEILLKMGLTEGDLAKMPSEQRAAVEKMISEEIQKRLAAGSAMDDDSDESTPQSIMEQLMSGKVTGSAILSDIGGPMKIDPAIALNKENAENEDQD